MFSSLLAVAVIAIFIWIGLFVFYLFTSQRQRTIEEDLYALEKKLGSSTGDE